MIFSLSTKTYQERAYQERESMEKTTKRAIVMGATSGMGRLVALGLLSRGWTIGIAGRRTKELLTLQETAPERVFVRTIDVTQPDAPALLHELIDATGGMDLYFHSSGYGHQNTELDAEIENRTVMTNAYGFTQMIDTAFQYFRTTRRKGRIAVISSIAGTKGLGAAPAYSATKRFQWTYVDSLAQLARMEGLDISFTDVRPGFVSTDFIADKDYPLQLTPGSVAGHILSALEKGRRVRTIDWRYRLLCFFWRLVPQCLWERMRIR